MTGHLPSDARVLDIGAGNGTFLKALPNGWAKHAVEMSEKGRIVLEGLGFSTFRDMESVGDGEFDVVVLSSVLEHFSSPLNATRLIRQMLKQTGVLWLVVPDSHRPRLSLGEFFGFEHVVHFSAKSLARLQRQAGLVNIHTAVMPDGALLSVSSRSRGPQNSVSSVGEGNNPSETTIRAAIERYVEDRANLRKQFQEVVSRLKIIVDSGRNLYIWGAGQHSAQILQDQPWVKNVTAFIDKKAENGRFADFMGRPVLAPSNVPWGEVDAVFISSESFQKEIVNDLEKLAEPAVEIILAYVSVK